jgi:predicted nucleic acid-binding protein
MHYLDTSVLVAAFTNEIATERVKDWLTERRDTNLCISNWVIAEYSAALSMKLRLGHFDEGHRADALGALANSIGSRLEVLATSALHFRRATYLADQHTLGLRAGDALHLAIAAEHGATLISLDKRLVQASLSTGIKASLL